MRYRFCCLLFLIVLAVCLFSSGSRDVFAATTELLIAPTGEAADDRFGLSVGTAGDVNGDGFDDLIVGAHNNGAGGNRAGRAYVFYGGPAADATTDLTLTGEAEFEHLGRSVGTAGDVNGDGFDDLIVGAYRTEPGGMDPGRAYVYYGGPEADSTADLIFTGEAAGDYFGHSVSTAGDVNGDGFDDLIVGAYMNDAGGTDAGRAYVYYGGAGVDAAADLTFTGAAEFDHFGYSVSTAGDVNGDGFDDLIVGAHWNGPGGRAYVYFGGAGVDTTADLITTGAAVADDFGRSVGTAGDVNGDGFADLIVGADKNDAGGTDAGQAYVYYGGSPGADSTADLTFTGVAAGDHFGSSVSTAGDINGDGFDDLIVGAYGNGAGGSNAGRAYVFYGGTGADATADLIFTGETAGDLLGYSVGTAGDVNGDGCDDLIVGAYWNDAGGTNAGRAYVYSSYSYRLEIPNGGEQWVAGRPATVRWRGYDVADVALSVDGGLSWSLLASGVGGHLLNEVQVAAPGETKLGLIRITYQGWASTRSNSDQSDEVFRIVPPSAPVAERLQLAPYGEAAGDQFGISASGAGDVNGDGFDDLIVGAYRNDASGTNAGRAYVYHGGPGAGATADLTFNGEVADDYFGVSVGTAGDVNGDGFDDLIVGAHLNDAGGAEAGRAYVFYGGAGFDTTADLIFTGEAAGDQFGNAVSGAADINGDGFDDLIVGAFGHDAGGTNAGRAYAYYGGPGADATPDLTFTGEAAYNEFGRSVSTAGDVNGDGFDDLIVGAHGNSAGGDNAGRAYVYYGGSGADTTADLILTGEAAYNYFGCSVSGAGDVDGDGFDDLIVGADRNGWAASTPGQAHVYYGGREADTIADLILTGEAAYDNYAHSVSGAGDINGDGFDDLTVGAFENDAGGTDAGRTYVYYGGPGADATADLILAGEVASDNFGYSVSRAGDVSGDGFDDLIVGAPFNDAGGAEAGRAYVYDCNRFQVLSPGGGDTWNVGAAEDIAWLGAEPADLWLSVDGGNNYSLLEENVGGSASNAISLTIPHQPTRFAKVKVTPHDDLVSGSAKSDSLFTIEASIELLNFMAKPLDEGGVLLTWETDPGPDDVTGYRVERADPGGEDWLILALLIRGTQYLDSDPAPGCRYRLFAVNGLGEELLLGETAFGLPRPLSAGPRPYRGGELVITFTTYGGLGGGTEPAEVTLFDVRGRRVRLIAQGEYPAGAQSATWAGLDDAGRPVASGVYFLRSTTGGRQYILKLLIVR